ncbi:putative ribosomal protein YlxQ [Fervidicola ferrireducens]|uniref:Putative ribosomal protein YlxQ n=1 Tax=Fervidicola ferrireducens TaxID=520764 RepID=A0A140L8Q0_9FIRM|nr:ribosomal L7Ae/L30e/S12e/Gadd45 family protein [Fervidicola ferrireducens]KXG76925.1 putative ribosomal protein YlxQ [Fervidicola ferrireducens]
MRPFDIPPLLGIARKAGKVIAGQEAVERAVLSKKVCLVIISEDASFNTKDKFISICKSRGINCIIYGTSDVLGKSIGKEARKIIGITDKNFSKEILRRLGATKTTEVGNIVES